MDVCHVHNLRDPKLFKDAIGEKLPSAHHLADKRSGLCVVKRQPPHDLHNFSYGGQVVVTGRLVFKGLPMAIKHVRVKASNISVCLYPLRTKG